MAIENITIIEPVNQLLVSYQNLVGTLKLALGGIFGLVVLATIIRIVQDMRFARRLKRIQRDINDIKERLDEFEATEEDAR